MSTIRNEIDQELKEMKLPSTFADTVIHTQRETPKPFYKRLSAAAILICACVILGTSAVAGYLSHQTIFVNNKAIPELDEMTVYPYAFESTKPNQPVHKKYNDYKSLKKEMPFSLLDSKYAKNEEMIRILYEAYPYDTGTQWIGIEGFILGDIKNLEIINRDCLDYSCSPGKEFDSPVHLSINILSDKEKFENDLSNHNFEGSFEFVEQYTSKQGYKVNIIRMKNGRSYHAIFVADGIKYELDGSVTLEKMKELVDSMEY